MTNKVRPIATRLFAVSAWALSVAAPAAHAEDSQPLSARMMQMMGLGGGDAPANSPAPESAPASPATPAQPVSKLPAAPSPPESPAPGSYAQNRVLGMLGLNNSGGLGGAGGPDGGAKEAKKPTGLEACPDFLVDGAGAEMRAPANAPASEVAYQIAISRMARECALEGDEISVRVGLLGAAMLGAAGKPGAYYGNVRIALRRKKDNQIFGSKTYRIGGAIPAGAARADFTLLAENLSAPLVSAKADEDYEVLIGFVQSGATTSPDGAEKPKRKRRGH